MKDITRIHIAKTPYNVELAAKKELESYIDALETYTADNELLQDIEIRITELLLERGVKPEDVISLADATAIREQLGEPKEFMTDEAAQDANAQLIPDTGSRTLYRNLDTAVLGGVLGGIASYLRVDAVWIRLAFVVLFFISAGMVALIYAVAWLIIPPARTAAEKLQMNGRAVTLSSIRELNESGLSAATEKRQAFIRRVLTTTLGLGALLSALGGLLLMMIVAIQLFTGQDIEMVDGYKLPLILMFISGALYVVLSLLVAFAAFTQKFNKRIWISAAIIIAAGLITFTLSVAGVRLSESSDFEARQRNMVESSEKITDSFTNVKTLKINIPTGAHLHYIARNQSPSIQQRNHKDAPAVEIKVEGETATISLDMRNNLRSYEEAAITVHGPTLQRIIVEEGGVMYTVDTQSKLSVEGLNSASFTLSDSDVTNVTAIMRDGARFDGNNVSISTVKLDITDTAQVSLGNIKTLSVKSADSCAAATTARLDVESIRDTMFDYNGKQTAAKDIEDPCFELAIRSGNEEPED